MSDALAHSVQPVLLCGGSGTRLWPLSRKSYPKQFVPLIGDETLFQASAKRLEGAAFKKPLVLTNSDFRFIVTEQLAEIGIDPSAVLIEPEGRNTAPAILAAAIWQEKHNPSALMLVAPSDHVVPDAKLFHEAVSAGIPAALDGDFVTFGIKPTHAETGYGYLELCEGVNEAEIAPIKLSRFVEKPDLQRAEEMIKGSNYLWNAGIFMFSVKTLIEAFGTFLPRELEIVREAVERAEPDLGFLRIDPEAWAKAKDISIDYAIMERAENLSVVPFVGAWSDLGGWDAVQRQLGQDENGVALSGLATAIDCKDTLLRSEDEQLELVGIGLSNIIAVAMPDAVLVADRSRSQDVKLAVDALKARNVNQATMFPKDHRPWGWFESLVVGGRFQVKRIHVHPGASLSLQSHHHRAEHWIVVEGTAQVTIDDTEQLVSENQSVYIPLGALHRLHNPGKVPVVIIEVQTGAYLGEDDIIRYEDIYARQ